MLSGALDALERACLRGCLISLLSRQVHQHRPQLLLMRVQAAALGHTLLGHRKAPNEGIKLILPLLHASSGRLCTVRC